MVAEAMVGIGICTAGGSNSSGVVVGEGVGATGWASSVGGDVVVGNLVVVAGGLPPCGDDSEVEDHGSRRRLADLDRSRRRPGGSGSRLEGCSLLDLSLDNCWKTFGILAMAKMNILAQLVFSNVCE